MAGADASEVEEDGPSWGSSFSPVRESLPNDVHRCGVTSFGHALHSKNSSKPFHAGS